MFQYPLQIEPVIKEFQSAIDNIRRSSFAPESIPGFPSIIYRNNLTRYQEMMAWFTGSKLEPEDPSSGIEEYPVRINPLVGTVMKHGYSLFGEVQDDGRPLVVTKLVPDRTPDKAERIRRRGVAQDTEKIINRMWFENFGRALMMRNGLTSQILGGSVFHLRYVPYQSYRQIPIQIERISPEQFVGFPEPGDEYRLRESWIVRPMTVQDAEDYGVTIASNEPAVYWIEHWTKDSFRIQVNEQVISWTDPKTGAVYPGEGPNPFGFVPTVYIPHIRAGSFYGESQITQLVGLVKEINLRWGDTGDAHNADTHAYVAYRNTNGIPRITKLAPGLDGLDLGSADSLAGDKHDPDAFEIRKVMVSEAHIKYLNLLYDQYRRDASVPKVADGEDEGSQRSAQTLVARMWPLVSHINTERIFWSDGLNWMIAMVLRMLLTNNFPGLTQESIEMRTRQVWASVLPKDRDVFIQELTTRAATDMGSPQHLVELTGDVEDVDEEVDLIKEWLKFKAEMSAIAHPQPAFGSGSNGSSTNTGSQGAKNGQAAAKKQQ